MVLNLGARCYDDDKMLVLATVENRMTVIKIANTQQL